MEDLRSALYLDAVLVIGVALTLLRAPQARLSHPGIIYVAVHAYIVTFRGWALVGGAPTFLGIDLASVAKAVLLADVFLVCAAAGWLAAGSSIQRSTRAWPSVDIGSVRSVSLISIPLGVATLLMVGYVPGIGEGSTVVTTSYQVVAVLWPALALIALIYVRGFKPWLLVGFFSYVAILGLQGHSRFRVVIPLILLLLIYLDARGRRWPQPRFVAVGLILIAVFIPLKQIGTAVRSGDASLSDLVRVVELSARDATRGTSAEQGLLDQAAITVLLVDDRGSPLLGRQYLALVTLPVPRPWWPEKPALNDHLLELSSARFPLAEVGGVTGVAGDLYLNFKWWGVVLGGGLFGWITGKIFRRAYAAPRRSTARFVYLLLAACMVQIVRDGLASIVVFTVVNATPWLLIAALSVRASDRERRARRRESERKSR